MDKENIKKLAEAFQHITLDKEIRIMEVCGTHTTEFFKTGVRDIFPDNLTLIDGPGCPVCVTDNEYLDRAIEIGKVHKPVITTFGDMIKVPSSYSSLLKEKASGMNVEVVYSPIQAVDMAEKNPDKEIMFLSVGFETTAPTEAVAVQEAKRRNIKNFTILASNKLTVPAVAALLELGEVKIDGFIMPGHVSAIIGAEAWRIIPEKYNKPSVIAGFEAHEMMMGTLSLIKLIQKGQSELVNEYKRVVTDNGNEHARTILYDVFSVGDAAWRGIGIIPGSGLAVSENYSDFDALKKFPVIPPEPLEHKGCRCGELLRGLITPPDCGLFGQRCTPEDPVGPCMVSTEGPCSAYYKYWRKG